MKSLTVYPVSVSLLGSNIPSALCSRMPLVQEIILHIDARKQANWQCCIFNLHMFKKTDRKIKILN